MPENGSAITVPTAIPESKEIPWNLIKFNPRLIQTLIIPIIFLTANYEAQGTKYFQIKWYLMSGSDNYRRKPERRCGFVRRVVPTWRAWRELPAEKRPESVHQPKYHSLPQLSYKDTDNKLHAVSIFNQLFSVKNDLMRR